MNEDLVGKVNDWGELIIVSISIFLLGVLAFHWLRVSIINRCLMIIDVLQSIKLICNFRIQSIINRISKLNSQAWAKLKFTQNSSKEIYSIRYKNPTIPPTMCSSTIHQKPSFSQVFFGSNLRTSMKWTLEGSRLFSTERLILSFIMANCSRSSELKRINMFNNASWKISSYSLPGTTQSS